MARRVAQVAVGLAVAGAVWYAYKNGILIGTEKPGAPMVTAARLTQGEAWLARARKDGIDVDGLRAVFRSCVARKPPIRVIEEILRDVPRTAPADPTFAPGTPRFARLQQVLEAYASFVRVHRPDDGIMLTRVGQDTEREYTQGMNFLAAHLLRHFDDTADVFVMMVYMLQTPKLGLDVLYQRGLPGVVPASDQLAALAAKLAPRAHAALTHFGFNYAFIMDWYFTAYATTIPTELLDPVWDAWFEHGWTFLLCVAVVLLRHAEPMITSASEFEPAVLALKSYSTTCDFVTARRPIPPGSLAAPGDVVTQALSLMDVSRAPILTVPAAAPAADEPSTA